jgi:PhnB protein
MPVTIGDNILIHLNVESEKMVQEIVEKLSKGGQVTMPTDKTFWGSVYGSFVDNFGVELGN